MSGHIILSKEHGVNPHLTFCPGCGKETNELVLTGSAHLFECPKCHQKYIGVPRGGRCRQCGNFDLDDRGEVPPEMKLPATELCEECAHQDAILEEEVRKGGVPWRCRDCKSAGVIKAETDIAKEWRARHGLTGLEMGKDECPVCGGDDAKH